MANLSWDGDDFRNEQDSSGSTADLVSHSGKLQQGYQHGSLTRGLVAYYPMEKGKGEILHDGALNNLGYIKGATWNGSGQVGSNALEFNASDGDYVDISRTEEIFRNPPLSVSMWVNPDSSSSDQQILSFGGTNFSVNYEYRQSSGYEFAIYDGNSVNVVTSGIKDISQAYLLTAVYDGTEMRFYVDGTSLGSTSSGIPSSQSGVYIGASPSNSNNYDGSIEEVRIYDHELSQPEIKALYNLSKPSGTQVTEKQVPSQDQGGISRYKLNGDVTDSWGTNDGTNNGVTFNDGVYGRAGKFSSGENDYIALPFGSDLIGNGSFTFSSWINVSDTTNEIAVGNYDGTNGVILRAREGSYDLWIDGSNNKAGSVPTEKWIHLLGNRDAEGNIRIYENGSVILEDSDSSNVNSNDNFAIGRHSASRTNPEFNGKIDDVRIYNRALTPQQVEKLYNLKAYRVPRRSTIQ